MKRELNIIIAAAAVWCAGFIIAPLIGSSAGAELLYRWYSVVCHQFESRSFTLMGEPFGVCIRCSSIYLSFLSMFILVRFVPVIRTAKFRSVPLLIVASLPMAVDGTLMLISLHDSTTISRIITGALFGGGMVLLLHLPLTESIHSLINKKETNYELEA